MSTKPPVASQFLGNGRFKLIEKIGEGAVAVVYLVEDTGILGVKRAMKVLKPHMAKSPEMRRRFLAEARAMALVENPGIVRIYDCGEEADGKIWILMELIEGGSLAERLAIQPLHPRLAVEVAVAVLAALAVAHQKGIVHRDIKPQNVMLTNSGEIKVADFGIAHFNVPDSLTKTGVFMGTDGFVSPEQRANSKDVDVRADIYSVAALLYCSLVVGEAMPVLFAADLDEKILAGIPDPLAAVIKKATRYQREDRYFSAEEMMTALKEVMEKLPEVSADTLPLVIPREEEEEGVVSIPTLIPDDLVEPPLFVSEFLGGFGKDSKTSLPFDQGTGQRPWLKVSIAIATTVAGVTLLALIWQFGWFEKNQPEPVVITQSVEVPPKEVSVEPILPSQTNEVNLPVEIRPPSIPTISKPRVVKPEPLIKKEEIVPEVVSTAVVVETQVPEVAIVDQVPELVHDAPLVWPAGQTFTPEAKISSGDYRVKIYFRLSGARAYTNFAMVKDGEVWRASVPIEAGAVGFEYHIAAEPKADGLPKLSSGSGFKPHIVRVE